MKAVAIPFGLLLFFSCRSAPVSEPVEVTRFLMDTVVRIAVYDAGLPRDYVEKAIDDAFQSITDIENTCSSHISGSEVSRLNDSAGGDPIPVSETTMGLLDAAVKVGTQTDGAFDVTVGVIKSLWGFDGENPSVPPVGQINDLLPLVDFHGIEREEGNRARLVKPGMEIDLGGIAKGLTIDEAVRILQEAGIKAGLVDAGGDMRIFGNHPKNPAWRIGVRHPRPDQNSLYAVLETQAASIATSGDYERFFEQDGKRFHHILDPKTGMPANQCISVTIVTESAMLADAYATAVFVMGPERGMAFIESTAGLEGLIISEQSGKLHRRVSGGLQEKLRFL